MKEQRALQTLPLELPLPGEEPGNHRGDAGHGSNQKIEIGRCGQALLFGPMRNEVKSSASNEQRNRKMDNDRVLSVSSEESRLQIEGIRRMGSGEKRFHVRIDFVSLLLDHNRPSHLRMD